MDTAHPLYVGLRPSRRLALAFAAAHLAAAGAVVAAGPPLWLVLAAGCALFVHGTITVVRAALLRTAGAVVALEAGRADRLPFRTRNGVWHDGQLLGSSYVAPYLVVINIRERGNRRVFHVLMVPDAIEAEDFRRLRVWLRWGCPKTL